MLLSIILLILLSLSAFFSASETAYTSLNVVRLRNFAQSGKDSAQRALKLHAKYDTVLSTILVANNIVNIASASIATIVFTGLLGNLGVLVSTVIMTAVILIFSEVSPKILAKERSEAFAMVVARPLSWLVTVFTPINWFFDQLKILLVKMFRLNKNKPVMTEEEFKIIVNDSHADGAINDVETALIKNSLKFDDTLVGSIMTVIDNAMMLEIDTPVVELKRTLERTGYSRVPLFAKRRDNVIGILNLIDFYEMIINTRGSGLVKDILKTPIWVEPTMPIPELFALLQKQKRHIAMVGSRGHVLGLVTMEDIIEELLGEIEDEADSKREKHNVGRGLVAAESEECVPVSLPDVAHEDETAAVVGK
jgi:CBS domain containing-hemolysin-like protein